MIIKRKLIFDSPEQREVWDSLEKVCEIWNEVC